MRGVGREVQVTIGAHRPGDIDLVLRESGRTQRPAAKKGGEEQCACEDEAYRTGDCHAVMSRPSICDSSGVNCDNLSSRSSDDHRAPAVAAEEGALAFLWGTLRGTRGFVAFGF